MEFYNAKHIAPPKDGKYYAQIIKYEKYYKQLKIYSGEFIVYVSGNKHCMKFSQTDGSIEQWFYFENFPNNPKNDCIIYWSELPTLVAKQTEIENLLEQFKEK